MNPVCPYCRTELADGEQVDCPECKTPHHLDCFEENGGCTIFGCSAAPPGEAKISLTGIQLGRDEPPAPRPSVNWAMGNSVLSLETISSAAAPAAAGSPRIAAPPPMVGTGAPPPPAISPSGFHAPARPQGGYPPVPGPKSRVVFVLLGIFLGIFGAHNFYAGYTKKAVIQCCLSVLTFFYGAVVSWVWALVEICIINEDADGEQFT